MDRIALSVQEQDKIQNSDPDLWKMLNGVTPTNYIMRTTRRMKQMVEEGYTFDQTVAWGKGNWYVANGSGDDLPYI